MATLRKSDIASSVAQKLGGSRSQGDVALNAVLDSIQEALAVGDRVVITGFGSFEIRQVKARMVRAIRGPQAGTLIPVPARKRVGFKPGTELARAVEPAWHERLLRRARGFVEDIVGRRDDHESP